MDSDLPTTRGNFFAESARSLAEESRWAAKEEKEGVYYLISKLFGDSASSRSHCEMEFLAGNSGVEDNIVFITFIFVFVYKTPQYIP